MQLLRLEDLARRDATALDLSSEIAARRLFAQVSGVRRSVPEDAAMGFLRAVRAVSARQDAELTQPATIEALPARRTEEVGPVRLEREEPDVLDDPDDLAEWDRENGPH